jgi:hypothetical protein
VVQELLTKATRVEEQFGTTVVEVVEEQEQ